MTRSFQIDPNTKPPMPLIIRVPHVDFLFIGDELAAASEQVLLDNRITRVLNVGEQPVPTPPNVSARSIPFGDIVWPISHEDTSSSLEPAFLLSCCAFIDNKEDNRSAKPRTLIFSDKGIKYSVLVAIAYLVRVKHVPLADCTKFFGNLCIFAASFPAAVYLHQLLMLEHLFLLRNSISWLQLCQRFKGPSRVPTPLPALIRTHATHATPYPAITEKEAAVSTQVPLPLPLFPLERAHTITSIVTPMRKLSVSSIPPTSRSVTNLHYSDSPRFPEFLPHVDTPRDTSLLHSLRSRPPSSNRLSTPNSTLPLLHHQA